MLRARLAGSPPEQQTKCPIDRIRHPHRRSRHPWPVRCLLRQRRRLSGRSVRWKLPAVGLLRAFGQLRPCSRSPAPSQRREFGRIRLYVPRAPGLGARWQWRQLVRDVDSLSAVRPVGLGRPRLRSQPHHRHDSPNPIQRGERRPKDRPRRATRYHANGTAPVGMRTGLALSRLPSPSASQDCPASADSSSTTAPRSA
jgi:hypothetical protein